RYLARVTDTEATDTENPNLNYGIVVDCGSSGSRIFVYCWPRHNGNPRELLDIQQMRDSNRNPVVMKIKPGGVGKYPGIPRDALGWFWCFGKILLCWSVVVQLLLISGKQEGLGKKGGAGKYPGIPRDALGWFWCFCKILLCSSVAVEPLLISGKQEGVYAWIGINFVLGRFEHTDDEDEAMVEVQIPGNERRDPIFRKRTVGILDMGGVSTQIAYEVPKSVSVASPQQEEVAKNLLAEFNLGCDAHQTEHVYRVYVATFLGFGGNVARQRYEESLFSSTLLRNRLLGTQSGLSPDSPFPDPCLPLDARDELRRRGLTLHLRGSGDFQLCRELLRPLLNKTNETRSSLNGVFQPPVRFQNSEFYGFSEFYYCTEDVLRMGGDYSAAKFARAAKDYCATKWSVLRERFDRGLYASHADLHRLKWVWAWAWEI
ncbi:ENTP4 diphosphohydrolase, partial [Ptilorrhoa leucosticta]|nr:ENTP4 diphosphohydrolase [Ptilorrhoa leucosticta]